MGPWLVLGLLLARADAAKNTRAPGVPVALGSVSAPVLPAVPASPAGEPAGLALPPSAVPAAPPAASSSREVFGAMSPVELVALASSEGEPPVARLAAADALVRRVEADPGDAAHLGPRVLRFMARTADLLTGESGQGLDIARFERALSLVAVAQPADERLRPQYRELVWWAQKDVSGLQAVLAIAKAGPEARAAMREAFHLEVSRGLKVDALDPGLAPAPTLKSEFQRVEAMRQALGIEVKEIGRHYEAALKRYAEGPDKEEYARGVSRDDQLAALDLAFEDPSPKRRVLSAAGLASLPDRQAWVTVNPPEAVQALVAALIPRLGNRRQLFDKALRAAVGAGVKELTDDLYAFYADEIADAAYSVLPGTKLAADPAVAAALAVLDHGSPTRLRYWARTPADLSLGDRCGDCTSRDGVNYARSLTWLYNPGYQVLKLSRGGRFLGKVNLALAEVDGRRALVIDALEFNPQVGANASYREDGEAALKDALRFVQRLARRQGFPLYAVRLSVIELATDTLDSFKAPGEDDRTRRVRPLIQDRDIRSALGRSGAYDGRLAPFYQFTTLAKSEHPARAKTLTRREAELERRVLLPAQEEDPGLGALFAASLDADPGPERQKLLETAGSLLLADPARAALIREIYSLPPGTALSPRFVAARVTALYGSSPSSERGAYLLDDATLLRLRVPD